MCGRRWAVVVEARHALNDPNQRRGDRGLAGGQGGRSARGQLHGLERGGEGGGHGRRRAADGIRRPSGEVVPTSRPSDASQARTPKWRPEWGRRASRTGRGRGTAGTWAIRASTPRFTAAARAAGSRGLEHHVGGDIDGRGTEPVTWAPAGSGGLVPGRSVRAGAADQPAPREAAVRAPPRLPRGRTHQALSGDVRPSRAMETSGDVAARRRARTARSRRGLRGRRAGSAGPPIPRAHRGVAVPSPCPRVRAPR